MALLLDLLVWLDGEFDHAKRAAAYGPGGDHAIGRSGNGSPVEGRFDFGSEDPTKRPRQRPELSDPLVRDLAKLRSAWRSQLGQLVDRWMSDSKEAANWPLRTEQVG